MIRQAVREDIPAMHAVRLAVRENVLRSPEVTEASYVPAIESTGRGWLTTQPDTRAQRFYAGAGWRFEGMLPNGEAAYEFRTKSPATATEGD